MEMKKKRARETIKQRHNLSQIRESQTEAEHMPNVNSTSGKLLRTGQEMTEKNLGTRETGHGKQTASGRQCKVKT